MCSTPIAEGRNYMHATNDVLGIEEPERLRLALRVEADAGQTAHSPAGHDISIAREPLHPEKVNAFGCWIFPFRANIPGVDVKYADDLGIPVGVGVLNILVREDHHICVHAWVERILGPPEVVCSIVDA